MSKKKVFLGVGHGGNDPGAVANGFEEADINLDVAEFTRDELVRHNVEVKMSRTRDENDPLSEEIRECNAYDPDLAADIHTNAGGGDGFEIFHSKGSVVGKKLANNINDEVKLIGQNSRGVKIKLSSNGRDYFGFVRETKCPAVICEGFFIDNKKDLVDFDTQAELRELGVAYAKGILKTLGISYKKPTTPSKSKLVRVNTETLNIRKGPSTDYPVVGSVKKGEVYTIVEEKGSWGKLKSGVGWIHLGYTINV